MILKSHRPRIALVATTGTVLLGLVLGGCSAPEFASGDATVLIVGNRRNAPPPELTGDALEAVNDAIDRGDQLVIVSESGEPRTVEDSDAAGCPGVKNQIACEKRRKNLKARIASILGDYPATAGGSSLLRSLAVASEAVESVHGTKRFIVLDNGIDTSPPLRLTDLSVLDWDPQRIVGGLRANRQLPDLPGVSVLFSGLGAVAAPQRALSGKDGANLARLWTAVLKQAGASLEKPLKASAASAAPERTDLADGAEVAVAKRRPPPPPINICRRFQLNEAQLGFMSDEANFVDRDRAKDAVRAYAQALKKSGLATTVTGTTAYAEKDPKKPLANDRAEAVERLLVFFGVSSEKILTQGVGIDWSGYKDPKGDVAAEIKMRLVLMDAHCP